jgi:O-antigen/teichoic acid export membrane protein
VQVNPDPTGSSIENPQNLSTASGRQSSDWDLRNGPKNYLSLASTQIGGAILSFASIWLVTQYLGSTGYGGIIAVIAASQVAQVLVNWTSSAVVRFGVDEFIETEKIARAFWVRFIILLINFGLVWLFARFWFPLLQDWLKLAPATFWLIIVHFAVMAIWIHIQTSLQAIKMMRLQGYLLMGERLLIFGALLVLVALNKLDFLTAVLTYILAPAAMILAGSVQLKTYIFARFAVDWPFIRKIILYSVPLLPFSVVGYFSGTYVDAVFVSKYLSTRDLGVYAVATQISGMALQFPTLVNSLLLPFFITLSKESQGQKTDRYFRHTLPVIVLFWGVLCTVACLFGYFLIPVIFGGEFNEAVLPLWILLTSSAIAVPVLAGYGSFSIANSLTYISMISAILAGGTNIVLNSHLIPIWGTEGCAWATTLTYFVSVMVHAFLLRKIMRVTISWTFFATTPSVAGAIAFSLTRNPWEAFAICLGLSGLVLYFKRESFTEALKLLKSMRYRNS